MTKEAAATASIEDDKNVSHSEQEEGMADTMTAEERFVDSFPEKQKKKLLRKMDLHIIPCLILLYRTTSHPRSSLDVALWLIP